MFEIFKRNKKIAKKTELIVVRSRTGMGWHVLDEAARPAENEVFATTLCDYFEWVPTNSRIVVTEESILSSIDNEHSGWYWCRDCIKQVVTDQALIPSR